MTNYYRLKDKYILRGWDKLPYAILNTETNAPDFIDAQHFNALNWCDGRIDTSIPLVSDSQRAIIHEYAEQGIVEPCAPGQAITPEQDYKFYPVRYVNSVYWSITGKCNYKCRHCYLSAPDAKYGELPHDVIMSFIPQIAACGVRQVSISGGEPLVRSDFFDIVDSLLEHGIRIIEIYSNGALVNESLLDFLASRGAYPEFNMSYDGAGWHDWMRGIAGAEKMVDRAFALCREKGFSISAEMCIHRLNKHTIRDSVNHLAGLGVRSLKISGVLDTGSWKAGGESENSLSISEMYSTFLEYLPHYYEDNMPLSIVLGGFFFTDLRDPGKFDIPDYKSRKNPDQFICGCSRIHMYISPDGRVLPCMPMSGTPVHDKMPSIQEQGLAKCINDSFWFELVNFRQKDFLAANSECRNCEHVNECSAGCRADALNLDPDNYMGKSPMICELIKGGWPQKIISVMKAVNPEIQCVNLQQ